VARPFANGSANVRPDWAGKGAAGRCERATDRRRGIQAVPAAEKGARMWRGGRWAVGTLWRGWRKLWTGQRRRGSGGVVLLAVEARIDPDWVARDGVARFQPRSGQDLSIILFEPFVAVCSSVCLPIGRQRSSPWGEGVLDPGPLSGSEINRRYGGTIGRVRRTGQPHVGSPVAIRRLLRGRWRIAGF
jgi:hypothetical protein